MFKQTKKNNTAIVIMKTVLLFAAVFAVFFAGGALAAGGAAPKAVTLSSIASNVNTTVSETATILIDVSIIAGIGFVIASFFKFHQHKLNPTQVPLSQGITLLLIGAGLMLVPTLIPTTTTAIFGKNTTVAQTGGDQIGALINGSGTQ